MAEIPDAEARIYNLLAQDPQARRDLLAHYKRLNPQASVPEIDAAAAVEEKINSALKPWQERVEDLQKKLDEKSKTDMIESRRSEVRGAPFYFSDEQIAELEKRMLEDGDRNLYGSYKAAARHYQLEDSMNHPTGAPIFSRHTQQENDWRALIKDPKSGIFDKRKRKDILDKKWKESAPPGTLIAAYRRGR
jgi:hypothetical protein